MAAPAGAVPALLVLCARGRGQAAALAGIDALRQQRSSRSGKQAIKVASNSAFAVMSRRGALSACRGARYPDDLTMNREAIAVSDEARRRGVPETGLPVLDGET